MEPCYRYFHHQDAHAAVNEGLRQNIKEEYGTAKAKWILMMETEFENSIEEILDKEYLRVAGSGKYALDWKVESGKEQFRGVDAVKFIMAVCVIILHTHPLEGINHTLNFITADVLGRIAVPFFFMATGFLLAQRKGDGYFFGIDHVKKYVYRILKLYIIWTAIYLPVIIYKNIIDSGEGLRYGILTSIRDFIFVGSYGHLWYLPATAVGVAAVFFLTEKIGERWSGILLFFLFLAGLLAQSYYGLLEMWTGGGGLVWNALRLLKKVMVTTRNGIFFGSFLFIWEDGRHAGMGKSA